VSFEYRSGLKAVTGLSLTVSRGEIVAFIGPSGCGKSTILRLIAGLLRPTDGVIEVSEPSDAARARLTMLFQEDTLSPWLRLRENAMLYYRFHKPDAGAADRCERLLTMVGLRDSSRAFPAQLSGGMRRRAAFVATVVPNPQVLLLDEPFSSVDEPTRIGIHQSVRDVVREFDIATILVTHDLAEAITLADRVVFLSQRPAHIAHVEAIPLGTNRDVWRLRQDPQYLTLYGRLWDFLMQETGPPART
jgi:NitT/TauT family transport system ATP-binding protein